MVEDNERNMKLLRDVPKASGYRTLEASTAGQALALAVEHPPALVLMDIRLPDMDGVEALRRLRMDPRTAFHPGARPDRPGDEGRPRTLQSRRASTATCRSRSISTSSLRPSSGTARERGR